MKRLLATLAAMIAGGALATTTITTNSTYEGSINFDAIALGALDTSATEDAKHFWGYDGNAVEIGVVTNSENDADNHYLLADTSNNVILRQLVAGGAAQLIEGEGYNSIYFDADVTFTAMDGDSSPDLSPEDKLVIWMKEDTSGETPTTNIVITSGVLNPDDNYSFSTSNEFVAVEACDGTAVYHLTVKAYSNIGIDDEIPVPGFKVEIDGQEIPNAAYNGYFASMVNYGANNYNKLKGMAFSGTGVIDNIKMASVTETIVSEETDFTFAVTVADEGGLIGDKTIKVNGDTYTAPIAMTAGGATEDTVITIPIYNENISVVASPVGVPEYYYDEDAEDYCWKVTVAKEDLNKVVAGGTLTVAITVEAGGSSGTHTIDPAKESLDENGALTVDDGTTIIKIGEYDVTAAFEIEGTKATLKPLVVADTPEGEDDAFVIDDENNEVTINVNPVVGLYYGVSAETDLGALERPDELTQYTGSNAAEIFTVSKPGAEKGFFKVYVDIKE